MKRGVRFSVVFGALALGACTGLIGDADDPRTSGSGASCGAGDDCGCTGAVCVPDECEGTCVAPSRLTRLTRVEYARSVFDLFGARVDTDRLPEDHEIYGAFASNEAAEVTEDDVDRYSAVAEATADTIDVAALASCTASEGDRACGERFIREHAPRVHRQPVSDEELSEYVALLEWSLIEGDGFEDAVKLVVSAFLQSPSFVYRVERVAEGATEQLDRWAMASRLSYFLWRTTPDDVLLAAAEAGELDGIEGVEAHARRMLADPRADAAIREFHVGWLGIGDVDRLTRDDPEWNEALGAAMRRETEAFALHVLRDDGGSFAALLGGDYTVIDPTMADFYGVSPSSDGRTSVSGRRGVLSHASVLTVHSTDGYTTPIYRGKLVRERFLCQPISPPPDVDAIVAERTAALPESLSERERLSALTGEVPCVNCHVLTNEIGFGFAQYDDVGRFRDRDGGDHLIDPAFVVEGPPANETDVDGEYAGPADFAQQLGESEDAALCMSAQWVRFALGRRTDQDGTSVLQAHRAFEDGGRDLRELIVAVTTTDAFRHRTAPSTE